MRIFHPQTAYQGIAPENVFFVQSDRLVQMGTGFLMPFFQGELYPERPLHFYFQMDAQPSARALLFGALLARSEQLRVQYGGYPTRLYTQLSPTQLDDMRFYQSSGFINDDEMDLFRFPIPTVPGRVPMGMQFASVPLQDPQQRAAFLQRVNHFRISPVSDDNLTLWQQDPYFFALGFYHNNTPVAEILVSGNNSIATLISLYTRSDSRRQGLAKQLIACTANYLRDRGVTQMHTTAYKRNAAQNGLLHSLGAVPIKTMLFLPGLNRDNDD